MRTLALPIRVNPDGQLQRADAGDTLMALIQAMVAASPARGSSFGVHEAFLRANMALQDHPRLADALNEALDELDLGWVRVAGVHTHPGAHSSERRFAVTLRIDGGAAVHGTLSA